MPNQKKKIKKCECCGKEIVDYFNTAKYCSSCSVYIMDLRRKIGNAKRRIQELEKKLIEIKFEKEIKILKESIK